MRKIYGPSQGAEMIRGLLEAVKELGPDQFTLLYHRLLALGSLAVLQLIAVNGCPVMPFPIPESQDRNGFHPPMQAYPEYLKKSTSLITAFYPRMCRRWISLAVATFAGSLIPVPMAMSPSRHGT